MWPPHDCWNKPHVYVFLTILALNRDQTATVNYSADGRQKENLLSLHVWRVKLLKIPNLVFQSISNWTILKEASIINWDQCRLINICFWTFTVSDTGYHKIYSTFYLTEIQRLQFTNIYRIWPGTLTEWLRATSGSEYSQMHTARFNLTYSLWVIGLTARCICWFQSLLICKGR